MAAEREVKVEDGNLPPLASSFDFEIEGLNASMNVISVDGIGQRFDQEAMSANNFKHSSRPGNLRVDNFTVTLQSRNCSAIHDWFKDNLNGGDETHTKNVTISLKSRGGKEVEKYSYTGCWPVSQRIHTLHLQSSENVTKSFEFAAEGLDIEVM